jgi:hypothetical protein
MTIRVVTIKFFSLSYMAPDLHILHGKFYS